MYENSIDKEQYKYLMSALKRENQIYINYLFNNLDFRIRQFTDEIINHNFLNIFWKIISFARNRNKKENQSTINTSTSESNYFSNKKIAIYTCITGDYDFPREPMCMPNNCDFYYISDINRLDENSRWKYLDINEIKETVGLANNEKNRFVRLITFCIS